MNKLRCFYYRILRKFNDGVPTRNEVWFKTSKDQSLTPRISAIVACYLIGLSLEQIAKRHDCTRERVRQILLKVCR